MATCTLILTDSEDGKGLRISCTSDPPFPMKDAKVDASSAQYLICLAAQTVKTHIDSWNANSG